MRGPAADFREAILARCPSVAEVVGKRTRHSKTWRLPNAPDGRPRYALDVSIAPVHYLDVEGQWQEIDYSHPKARSIADGLLVPMGGRLVPAVAGGTTIDDTVAEDLGDIHELESTGACTDLATGVFLIDNTTTTRFWGGFRWHTASWPGQGDTIDVAYAELYVYDTATDDVYAHIYADDAASPAALAATDYNLSGRTPTTAKVDWTADGLGVGYAQSPSIVSVIQELVDDYTITAIALVVKPGSSVGGHPAYKRCYVRPYNYGPGTYPAKLHIEYSAPALEPGGIVSAEAFGAPAVAGPITVSSIASAEVFGALTVANIYSAGGIASEESFGSPGVWHRYRCTAYLDDGEYLIQHEWPHGQPSGFCEEDHEFIDYWATFDWHECGLEERAYGGDGLGDPHDYYIRISDNHLFPVVTIPAGFVVEAAVMRFNRYSGTTGGTRPGLHIKGEAADDAGQIADEADWLTRVHTDAVVDWSPDGSVQPGEWWETPDVIAILHEIIRRPGWSSGQAIQIFLEADDTLPLGGVGGMWTWRAARNLSPPPTLREDRPELFIRLTLGALPVGMASAEAFGTPDVRQVASPSAIASAETFGTLQVNLHIAASAIASAEVFGGLTLTLYLSPSAIGSTEALGSPTIAVHAHPSGIASAEAFGSPFIAGPIAASAIASAEAFGSLTLHLKLYPSGITSIETFGSGQLNLGLATGGIASAEAFGTMQVNQHVAPSGIVSAEAFGGASLNLKLAPSAIATAEALGSPSVAGAVTVIGIATAEAFGTPQINLGAAAGGIASTEAFGTAVLTTGTVTVSPSSITSTEAFGAPLVTLAGETQTVIAIAIASVEAFGTALLTGPISTTGIASAEAFGSASMSTGAVTLQPSAVASAETFGILILVPIVTPSGIASAETFGMASLSVGGPQTLTLTGIASAEAFGSLIAAGPIAPTGIGSAEAFGTLTIGLKALPAGIASAEAFGTAAVSIGSPQSASPSSIASLEVFGLPIVAGPLTGVGIASSEAFGTAEITVAGIQTLWPDGIVSVEAFGTASVGPSWVPVVIDDGTIALVLVQDGSVSLPGAVNDGTISIKETEDATI